MLKQSVDSLQVGMVARNVEAMLDFYTNTLGLKLQHAMDIPSIGKLHSFALGSNAVKILVPEAVPSHQDQPGMPWQATGIRYWTVVVEGLDDLVQTCASGGGQLMGDINQLGNVRFAMVNDPDGNCLEFIERVTK